MILWMKITFENLGLEALRIRKAFSIVELKHKIKLERINFSFLKFSM